MQVGDLRIILYASRGTAGLYLDDRKKSAARLFLVLGAACLHAQRVLSALYWLATHDAAVLSCAANKFAQVA